MQQAVRLARLERTEAKTATVIAVAEERALVEACRGETVQRGRM
jgi:hypothetical protein